MKDFSLEERVCVNCNKRPATLWWSDSGLLGLTHGFTQPRCEVCSLEAQIPYAEERAAELTTMKTRLTELLAEEAK